MALTLEQKEQKAIIAVEAINAEFHGFVNGNHIMSKANRPRVHLTCKCCGYEWTPLFSHIVYKTDSGKARGCPSCAKSGYKSSDAGTFYVVQWTHPVTGHSFLKYGISNNHKQRFKQQQRHTEYLPTVLFAVVYEDGKVAQNIERMCHEKRENKKGIISETLFGDGYTETMTLDNYDWLNALVDFQMKPMI